MSYFKAYVDGTGLHFPTYEDIMSALVEDMQGIFGAGIYLGQDSPDYQELSKISEKIYDVYQTAEIVYNGRSPVTAIGTGLDLISAINGIKRKTGTKSQATLTISGVAGTVITGGVVSDMAGNLWSLPDSVTIEEEGEVTVDAVCQQIGVIQAAAGTITQIMTPTQGWESVTNEAPATTGINVETDSSLRARRAKSVANPSVGVLRGLEGALRALDDVGRCVIYENDTDDVDDNGIPAHSICCVVEGGDPDDIARTIKLRKAPGCGTYGSSTVAYRDESGHVSQISYTPVVYVDVDIEVNIVRRSGYEADTASAIQLAIMQYMSEFTIGMDLPTSIIAVIAQSVNSDIRSPSFTVSSVRAAKHGQTLSQNDVAINYDSVARGNVLNITVNVT